MNQNTFVVERWPDVQREIVDVMYAFARKNILWKIIFYWVVDVNSLHWILYLNFENKNVHLLRDWINN